MLEWGWFYLSTILDDYSRYIIAWKLYTRMKTEDVTDTLDLALQASGCDQATVLHKARLLSDNGSSCISGELHIATEELDVAERILVDAGDKEVPGQEEIRSMPLTLAMERLASAKA
ncbi:Integrase core domain protein [Ruegeria meonggei]|uniref:Integrase core domain protein n=1 Tax=Ruegeria meonggei TaxID=1446476 RepID=A0A1X6Z3H3_9RHOB|nr:Integrase core domain protein [Ruegeria meonggei]